MKLLITGGCGFLGSNLASDAINRRYEVVIFDNLYREGARKNLSWRQSLGSIRFEYGDIRSLNDISRVIKMFKPEAIFHLAGQVAMTTSIANPRMDFEVNVLGAHNLLEAVRLYAPECSVVYSSTNKVYGDLEQYRYEETATRYICLDRPEGFDESTPLDFRSPYGCSKGAAEQYMIDYARIYDLKTVVFRHSSMYGDRQFASYDQGWVSWFCERAIDVRIGTLKGPITISGNGKQVRDVLHADDMKSLFAEALTRIDLARGKVFNIGGGTTNSLSIIELFGLIEKLFDVQVSTQNLPPRISDQKVFVADISFAKSILAWQPQISAEVGLESLSEWLKCERESGNH